MYQITLPQTGTDKAWRDEARKLLLQGVPPEAILWERGASDTRDLFACDKMASAAGELTVPRAFLALARDVVWHRDPERFARLYACLWRLKTTPGLLADRADPEVTRLHAMAKEVRRDKHKMTAFVRFREITGPQDRRRFAAWFEPSNFIVEPTSDFFVNRFGDMDWTVFTPDLTADFSQGRRRFLMGHQKPDIPPDATEDLWRTYFSNIFNPARLKPRAMQSEMPKKYWKNLPEADLIPDMIADASARVARMAAAAPTLPSKRARRIKSTFCARVPDLADQSDELSLSHALAGCRRCPLWKTATQAVAGEGPPDARLMIVGEQPGDQEDLSGRPFVGPAGQLFDRVAREAGIVRERAYITNAVKHFKFTPRGKKRLHQTPSEREVQHCRWWLDQERRLVRPDLIIALGATAAGALTGNNAHLLKRRGKIELTGDGMPVLLTVHPSFLLRLQGVEKHSETARFQADIEIATRLLSAQTEITEYASRVSR